MQQIVNFILRNKAFLFFLLLLCVSVGLTIQSHSYHKSKFINSANSITGGGSLMIQKNRVRGFFEIMIENDMNVRNDAIVLKELSASPLPADWTVTHINGTVWAGYGVPVGDITPDMNAGTMTLKVVSKEFVKIVG